MAVVHVSARRFSVSRSALSAVSLQRSLSATQSAAYLHWSAGTGSQFAGSLSDLERLDLAETATRLFGAP